MRNIQLIIRNAKKYYKLITVIVICALAVFILIQKKQKNIKTITIFQTTDTHATFSHPDKLNGWELLTAQLKIEINKIQYPSY